jgi:hypothetical protein
VHHQLQALLLHAGPPEGRLDVVDGGRLGAGSAGGEQGGADEDTDQGMVNSAADSAGHENVSVSSATTSAFQDKCPGSCVEFALFPREYTSEGVASTKVPRDMFSLATPFLLHKYMHISTDIDMDENLLRKFAPSWCKSKLCWCKVSGL